MFGFSTATQLLQGSTRRTWNCVAHLITLIWSKFNHIAPSSMPRSRKRHHSRSRSKTRSRSPSRDKSYDKHKKPSSHEKDGKRRRLDDLIDSPHHKRSISSSDDESTKNEELREMEPVNIDKKSEQTDSGLTSEQSLNDNNTNSDSDGCVVVESTETNKKEQVEEEPTFNKLKTTETNNEQAKPVDAIISKEDKIDDKTETIVLSDSDDTVQMEVVYGKKENVTTPKKPLTPKQLQKRIESEKKRMQKQKEREERERQREEEKAKILAEKQKIKEQKEAERLKIIEEKQKQLELKQKEKEMKEEQKRKEKEEKEQKRKEKEEQEAQKRKEKELERLKKLQEIEEKNKEKQREEEKKQKTAALFKNFFKKTEVEEKESKVDKVNSYFKPFEVKSDMRLPPSRRQPLTCDNKKELDKAIEDQDENKSYLQELKTGKIRPGKSSKTWPYEDRDDEVTIVEEDKVFGENICEDARVIRRMKAKFLYFHENRRPPYFGTWRKKSKSIKPRKPFGEDADYFNYEEDSDDDWEEEEQGESLDVSGDEEEKDENDEDDYEVDNEFFVPHGHLSDDEVDDEENAPLSPESLKQKLKLLKDEFDEDMKCQTRKLKPRSIGCIWFNKKNDNIDEAIYRYLQPFAMICNGPIDIKEYLETSSPVEKKKVKAVELPNEHVPFFLKIIHGNTNKNKTVVEEFLTYMTNNDFNVDVSKTHLTRFLKQSATYKRCKENGPLKNKFGWFVNDDVKEKYNVCLDLAETKK